MIPIDKLRYEVKLSMDKIDSLSNPNLMKHELDHYIWRGIKTWFREYASMVEGNQEIIDPISKYHVVEEIILPTGQSLGRYEIPLSSLDYPDYKITKVYAIVEKNKCIRTVETFYKKSNDKELVYNAPNFEWGQVPYNIAMNKSTEGESSIFIDTDGTFKVLGIIVHYIRLPKEPFSGGYNSINGIYTTTTPPIDSDIDEVYLLDLVKIITNEIKTDTNE